MSIPVKSKTDNAVDGLLDALSAEKAKIRAAEKMMEKWEFAVPNLHGPFDEVRRVLGLLND